MRNVLRAVWWTEPSLTVTATRAVRRRWCLSAAGSGILTAAGRPAVTRVSRMRTEMWPTARVRPETAIVDGYGAAAPEPGIAIDPPLKSDAFAGAAGSARTTSGAAIRLLTSAHGNTPPAARALH